MKRRMIPAAHATHPNVTPLIDVVMCLIIFFMLVARIGVNLGAEPMNIPASLLGADIKDMANTLVLNVRPGPMGSDQPLVTALINGRLEELRVIDPATGQRQLVDSLRYIRYGRDTQPNTPDDNPEFKVIIRAEESTPYRFIEPVLLASVEANVKNVNFNTRKGE